MEVEIATVDNGQWLCPKLNALNALNASGHHSSGSSSS